MEQTGKKLMLCLIVVVLAAVAVGIFYWYAGGIGLSDGAVLVRSGESEVFRCLV